MKFDSVPLLQDAEVTLSSAELEVLRIKLLTEIYTNAPERRRECLYFLAIGHFKISNYSEARRFNDQLLKLEPRNDQAASLKKLIDEKVSTEGVIGLAIVSGVVAVGAALLAAVVKRSK
ncbi:unnamed protein product [Rhizopus stolonifer]